jgi:hypothetical protein
VVSNNGFDAVFGTVWVAALLVVCLAMLLGARPNSFIKVACSAVFGIALAARIVPALILNAGATFDIDSYWIVGHVVYAGWDVYAATEAAGRYPYLPAQLWLSAFAVYLVTYVHIGVPFVVLVKLLPALADAGTSVMIIKGLEARGHPRDLARYCGILYAVNPVTVLVTAYHGQFDALPVFFIVAAWAVIPQTNGSVNTNVMVAGLALGMAILAKSWPEILLPAFVLALDRARGRARFAAWLSLLPVLATAGYVTAYHVPLRSLVGTIANYTSIPGWWGVGAFSVWMRGRAHLITTSGVANIAHLTEAIVIASAIIIPIVFRGRSLTWSITAVLLVFYVLTANFAVQYVLWIVPFGVLDLAEAPSLNELKPLIGYLILSTVALMTTYLAVGWIYHAVAISPVRLNKIWQYSFYLVYADCVWWCVLHLRGAPRPTTDPAVSLLIPGHKLVEIVWMECLAIAWSSTVLLG